MTDLLKTFSETISAAAAAGRALRPRGGGSKDFYGGALKGEVLDTRAYAGIVDYEPTELVVTARAGTLLADLEAALAARGQSLAFEPPHFGAATLGGCIAAGLSGPRRAAAGSVRDFVLGVRMMDGAGRDLSFGGQVMKNVAGYDVSRLMTGSMGTLGLILEVSLKVLPLPQAEASVRFEMPEEAAIRTMNQWAGKPLPISATAFLRNELTVRLAGAGAAVAAAKRRLGGEDVTDGAAFWTALREQAHDFFQGDGPLWRLSVPSASPPLALAGPQLLEWGGALRWLRSAGDARTIREAAAKAGGHATLFRAGGKDADKSAGAFHPLDAPLLRIHRNLKQAFDPKGIFSPGRMYAEF